MYTKFERKKDQKLTYFFHVPQNFGLSRKITNWEDLVNVSAFEMILRNGLAFKYYLVLSKHYVTFQVWLGEEHQNSDIDSIIETEQSSLENALVMSI